MTTDANHVAVLVIDNNDVMRESCKQILARSGYRVTAVPDAESGLGLIASLPPSVVILDLYLPRVSGMELIPRIRDLAPHAAVIVITGYPTIETAVAVMKHGATDFLPKPFTPERLRTAVAAAVDEASVMPR
ncbi:MAG: response regulator [Gemmatimonadales bacterium]|jgi:DNA-binding NtrC family response regulator|nr:response regulator [Gemmatimonadales bacterium]